MRLNINCGVLIIGSLFWDNNQGKHINQRKNWRKSKLSITKSIHVKVPIRYGRESGKIPKTYTMVFSKEAEKKNELGTAYLVPIKRANIAFFKGLQSQAEFLSEAEGIEDKKIVKGNKKKWCTIGLIVNPKLSTEKKDYILNKWKDIINNQGLKDDDKNYKIGNEESVLSERGEIFINWITAIDNENQTIIDEFDIVLASATKPNLRSYPLPKELIERNKMDKRKYFYNNIKNGIFTFLDTELINI